MREIVALALAGAAGTLGRWALGGWAYKLLGERFAYGTLAVNVLGCLLLGLLMHLSLASDLVPEGWRVALGVGFLGAFTTFSTFGYETLSYAEQGAWSLALANVVANLVLGLAAIWLGAALARGALGGA
jgi:CrcB protein